MCRSGCTAFWEKVNLQTAARYAMNLTLESVCFNYLFDLYIYSFSILKINKCEYIFKTTFKVMNCIVL